MTGLLLGGRVQDAGSILLSAVAGAAAVWLGLAAAACCRTISPATTAEQGRRLIWSLAAGVALGLANLGANWLIASYHPTLRALLLRRFASIGAIDAIVAAPLMEEVLVRLCLMSVIAWIVWQLTDQSRHVLTIALIASSLVFALLHLARPFPGDPGLVAFYRGSLLVKYTLAGFPMGWLFWRWGLPYAILCHVLVNVTHIALQRFVF